MKNVSPSSLFTAGINDFLLRSSQADVKENPMNELSIFYRLGFLTAQSQNRPTLSQLLKELYREFYFCHNILPNLAFICLQRKYSNRLLKRTLASLGYRIPIKPNYLGFNAWRVK